MSILYAISFDVELDRLVPEQWTAESTPFITCAAIYSKQGSKKFYSSDKEGTKAPRMTLEDAAKLFDELWDHAMKGALIISWGGTAVDFRALYFALQGDYERQLKCKFLVMHFHIDIPIASSTDMGMMMGLDAASKGSGQGEKSNKDSCDAPRLWQSGDFEKVLSHVEQDAVLTLKVYEHMMNLKPPSLNWTTKSGKLKTWYCSTQYDQMRNFFRLNTVAECLMKPMKIVPFELPKGMNRDFIALWLFC